MKIVQTDEGWSVVEGDTHISKWVKDSGRLDHDQFLIPFVSELLKPGMTVLDCGANIGTHTIAYSDAVGGMGNVFAIEAGKLAFRCLVENSAKFKFKNVETINAVVSHMPDFYFKHSENQNLGASRVSVDISNDQSSVRSTSIDFIRKKYDIHIDFIKIDIEGWEYHALQGARECLEKDRPNLLIEINRGALEINKHNPFDIIGFLEKFKYKSKIVQPDCDYWSPQFDIHCYPD